ncbi:Protein of unknown function DUF58 [Pseudidiomarina planktonica]|uniref:DUF58 domain-containing protein n=1 Tax=Pseudidiomarina planktonica TaxID=1323738 RepID=A0A1Y6ELF4_9GAMM|nr:DUF58 domain-containing protein [Pseudidiomarina planktonica]RUO65697.1 DUF58 domain-containing protein [Pseudidiomarina planktonica]SMQ63445.1 Protein of unknown function DUF58 [Pseudidiomarina planktonica]
MALSTTSAPATTASDWLEAMHASGIQLGLAELMYYHSKLPAFRQHARRKPPRGTSGGILSKQKGRGMEFDEVRHYQPGDDIRAIDWRVTARTGSTHTKLYREEQERPVFIVTDLSASMLFGTELLFKSVQAAHLAAALAWRAQQRGDRIGGIVGNGFSHSELKPQGRHQGVMRYIHALLDSHQQSYQHWQQRQQSPKSMLTDSLQRLSQLARPGSEIYLISDFVNVSAAQLKFARALQQHCQVRAFIISDPFEHQLPAQAARGKLELSDLHQHQQTLDLNHAGQRQQYQAAAAEQQRQITSELQRFAISYQHVSAARALEQQWQEIM